MTWHIVGTLQNGRALARNRHTIRRNQDGLKQYGRQNKRHDERKVNQWPLHDRQRIHFVMDCL
jgi:hypothetical protein